MAQYLLLLSIAAIVTGNATIEMPPRESVSATLSEVTELLEQGKIADGSKLPLTFLSDINERMTELADSLRYLETLTQRMLEKESKINSILQIANTRSMDNLADRLEQTLHSEVKLRRLEIKEQRRQQELLERKQSESSVSLDPVKDDAIEISSINLAERLDTNAVMGESETQMKEWILTIIQEEIGLYKKSIFDMVSRVDTSRSNNIDRHATKETDCATATNIIQQVQQALNDNAQDGIGTLDQAQGASVVNWLTSETYSPFSMPSRTFGSVWWNKFIPQDWERILPNGWENWEVGIPPYAYHSLSFLSGDIAPPEAVLQKNTLPGSCWPMAGSSGQITLKLANPVVVESVSIDHVSSNIIPEGTHDSAPRRLKITGYPSCDELESECRAIGFDLSDPINIADVEYNIKGPSVQTFESEYAKAIASVPTPSFKTEDTEPGSCSMQTSCSTPSRIGVAAIEVKVLENWGNPDFTCLYRLRVHGDTK